MTNKVFISATILTGLLVGCSDIDRSNPEQSNSDTSYSEQSNAAESAEDAEVNARTAIERAIDRHTLAFIREQPTLSTVLDIEEDQAGGAYNDRLPDYSPQGMQRLQSIMRSAVAQLSTFDSSQLEKEDALHLDIVKVIERYYAGSEAFPAGYIDTWGGHLPYIVNQIAGPLIDVPKVMQVQQRVASIKDAQAYLTRLTGFREFTGQILEKLKADEAAGVILPKKLFPKTLAYFENFLSPPAEEHALVTTFEERLNKLKNLKPEERDLLVARAVTEVHDTVYPGYRKIADFLSEQQQRAPAKDGIWAQPGGNKFYQHEIRYLGDSSMKAEDIHKLGLSEVKRISAEMDAILKANGYSKGSVGKRMAALSEDPRFLYENSTAGREKLLNDLNVQVNEVLSKASTLFATIPQAKVEVRRISEVSEAGEPSGFYTPPSLDGNRPGIYWINLRDMNANPSFSLKTLTYHEAVPGHHFQIALNMAQQDIGLLRQNAPFNAYVEGWALYAELVAKEMGMYTGDPWGDLGRLQAELYRAVRLVVDTGLHAKKWTREQAIDYFYRTTGTPMSDVEVEVERYMAWPGQALGYKLGMLQLVELRERARKALGDQFDLREYHDLILLPGARPMELVKADVEDWIAAKKTTAVARN